MSDSDLQRQIAAAKAYEEFFVPALFGQWTSRAVAAAQIQTGHHGLDVACGTGVLAREIASRVGPSGFVAGLDSSPGMLAVAADLAPRIDWRRGTAEALPYPDERFDAVVSQFGLMFFADRRQSFHEMHRVLKRDGHPTVAVWASLESAPAYATEVALVERLAGTRAADALRAPFVLGDPRELARFVASTSMPEATITSLAWNGAVSQHSVHGRGRPPRMAAVDGGRSHRASDPSNPAGSRACAWRVCHGERDRNLRVGGPSHQRRKVIGS